MGEPAAHIAFATAAPFVAHDLDRPLIAAAAERLGLEAAWPSWDDATVEWAEFDAVVIRSTWDYHERLDEFLAWARHVGEVGRLFNDAALVRWNAHKRYLVELEDAGVPVVPTELVRASDAGHGPRDSFAALVDRRNWHEVVVKPAVSAGAKATGRYAADDPQGALALQELVAHGDALVQPYLPEIESNGETSLIVIDGEVTHAVAKVPAQGDFRVQAHLGGAERPVAPTAAERDLVTQLVDVTPALSTREAPMYARVDCVDVDGRPTLMELELIEPFLFLSSAEGAAERFVEAVLARL